MFSSADRIRKRTPQRGIDRKEYITLLVDEYYETTNLGKKFLNLNLRPLRAPIYKSDIIFYFKFIFRSTRTSNSKFSKFCI